MEIKIPFYNVINMFLTGLVFAGGCTIIYWESVLTMACSIDYEALGTMPEILWTVCAFAIIYEFGLIINRIGSVITEPILRKCKIIPFCDDYVLFNLKKIEFPVLDILSREYAVSRTSTTLFFILGILAIPYCIQVTFISVGIMIVYLFSCRKYAGKIVKLMKSSERSDDE